MPTSIDASAPRTAALIGNSVQLHALGFTASPKDLYVLAPEATTSCMADQISARLAQLDALLSVTCGEIGAIFRNDLSPATQENFMWACNDMVIEVRELFEAMQQVKSASGIARGAA